MQANSHVSIDYFLAEIQEYLSLAKEIAKLIPQWLLQTRFLDSNINLIYNYYVSDLSLLWTN